jgi:hypothetical protein
MVFQEEEVVEEESQYDPGTKVRSRTYLPVRPYWVRSHPELVRGI